MQKSILTFLVSLSFFLAVTQVNAANTPTPKPLLDTRIECVSGSDGKQVCQTVSIERTSSNSAKPVTVTPTRTSTPTPTLKPSITPPGTVSTSTSSGTPQHTVVNTGVQENIIALLFVGFMASAFGYTYAKVKAQ